MDLTDAQNAIMQRLANGSGVQRMIIIDDTINKVSMGLVMVGVFLLFHVFYMVTQ